MKSNVKLFASLIIATLSVGCSTATLTTIPSNGNIFTIIAVSSDLKTANATAARKAQDICVEQNSDLIVLDQEATYQGLDKDQQALVSSAKTLLPGGKTAASYTPPDHNYKVTLDITCDPAR